MTKFSGVCQERPSTLQSRKLRNFIFPVIVALGQAPGSIPLPNAAGALSR
jgi:hypothetical protein